jgi:hypothetical protein
MAERLHLELQVNNMPYIVEAEPCQFNDQTQFNVSANNSDDVLFVFDREVGRYIPAGDTGGTFPEDVATQIGNELNRISMKNPRG